MRLTNDHLRFWRDRQPQPSWALQVKRTQRPPSIHNLINSQDASYVVTSEPFNTLSILKSLRQRGEPILPKIMEMSVRGNCSQARKREVYCRRWLRRLLRNSGESRDLGSGRSCLDSCGPFDPGYVE